MSSVELLPFMTSVSDPWIYNVCQHKEAAISFSVQDGRPVVCIYDRLGLRIALLSPQNALVKGQEECYPEFSKTYLLQMKENFARALLSLMKPSCFSETWLEGIGAEECSKWYPISSRKFKLHPFF